jgi:hypothetical protein
MIGNTEVKRILFYLNDLFIILEEYVIHQLGYTSDHIRRDIRLMFGKDLLDKFKMEEYYVIIGGDIMRMKLPLS